MTRIGGSCPLAIQAGSLGPPCSFERLTHHPHLHGAGVGAQHLAFARGVGLQPEGVVHLPRRVLGREVEGGKVVEVVLDVGALRQAETHLGEDGDHLVHHLHGGVHAAAARGRRGQRQVDALGGEPGVEVGGLQHRLALSDRSRDAVAQAVDQRSPLAPPRQLMDVQAS